MKKIKISPEQTSLFTEMVKDASKNLSFEQIQAINDSLVIRRKEYVKSRSKIMKFSINFIITLAFGLLFSISHGFILFIPFAAVLVFFLYKLFIYIKKMIAAKISIGNGEYTKMLYFESNF